MTDSEKLVKTRNFIRYVFRELYLPFDIEYRTNDDFRNRIRNEGVKIGVFDEPQPELLYLTEDEIYRKPRHRGNKR